jgi:hypothetical protein
MAFYLPQCEEPTEFVKQDYSSIVDAVNNAAKCSPIAERLVDPGYTQPVIQQVEQSTAIVPAKAIDFVELSQSRWLESRVPTMLESPMQRLPMLDIIYRKIPSGKDYGHNLLQTLCYQYVAGQLGSFTSVEQYFSHDEFKAPNDILTFDSFVRRWMKHGNGPFIIRKDTLKDIFFQHTLFPHREDKLKQVQFDMMCFKQLMTMDMMRCCRIISAGQTTSTCLIINNIGQVEQRELKNTDFTNYSIQVYHESWHSKCLEDKAVGPKKVDPKKRGEQSEDEVVMKPFNVSIFGNDGFGDFSHYLRINRTISATTHRMEFDRDCKTVYYMLGNIPHERKMFLAKDIVRDGSSEQKTYSPAESELSKTIDAGWQSIITTTRPTTRVELFSVNYRQCGVNLIKNNPLYVYQYLKPGISLEPHFVPNPKVISYYTCFIRNYICGGAASVESTKCAYQNMMSILKFALLTGEKPMQAIVLKGERGSGKSNFCQWISTIFGRENTAVLPMIRLGQQFNSYLAKRLILFDETNFSSKTADGRQSHTSRERCNAFKELITGLGHLIEPKGKEAYWMESSALVMACQDNDDVLPEESLHRRIVFTETYKIKVKDQSQSFQDMLYMLNDAYNLQNLVAYFCATPNQIATWNYSLDPIEKIPELPSLAEIHENLGRLSNPHADQGLGSEVDVRVAEHVAAGNLFFRQGLMFIKDETFRTGQNPGCIFMHSEGFMRMWYLSMLESECTPAQISKYFTEYTGEVDANGKPVDNPNMFTFDERKHKDFLKWMSMLSIQDENGYFINPNLGKKTRVRKLEKWGLHEAAKCKGEFFFYFSRGWSEAFGRLLSRQPGQEYPKFIQGNFQIMLLCTDRTERPLQISDIPSVSFGGSENKVKVRADERIINRLRAAEQAHVRTFVPLFVPTADIV